MSFSQGISSWVKKIDSFDIEKEAIDILEENIEFLKHLLTEQLSKGIDGDGNQVTIFGRDYYSKFTIEIKTNYGKGLGSATDRITNYMGGLFYSSIFVKINGRNFSFSSDVPYFSDILLRSGGEKIIQLNRENLDIFTKSVMIPELQKRFKSKVNGV